jgi:hypothetical protein
MEEMLKWTTSEKKEEEGGEIEVATRSLLSIVSLHPYYIYFFFHRRDIGRKPIAKEEEEE